MATVQVRNVPEEVHRRLKVEAAQNGRSLNEFLLGRLTEWAERPTLAEYAARVEPRPAGSTPTMADIVAEIRKDRDSR
jgi:plasmid stability protein